MFRDYSKKKKDCKWEKKDSFIIIDNDLVEIFERDFKLYKLVDFVVWDKIRKEFNF